MYFLVSENKNMIAFGLLVSGFIQFLLPYADVSSNAESYNFGDKMNQSIQFIVAGLIIALTGLFTASVGYKKKHTPTATKRLETKSKPDILLKK